MSKWNGGLIALSGLPGAGKSTLARELVRIQPDFEIVSRDIIREAMFQNCQYSVTEKDAAFRASLEAIQIVLHRNGNVIVDGMCLSSLVDYNKLLGIAQLSGSHFLPIYCGIDLSIAEMRVADDFVNGKHSAADRTPELVRQVARNFRQINPDTLRLDMECDPVANAFIVLREWISLRENYG